SRRLSPVEVTEHLLARQERFEGAVNAFTLVDREGALTSARASEARYRSDAPLGPIDGVPATVKDNIALQGLPNRKGSAVTPAGPETF
ncbi:amidase family protein, partial [Neokomagataea anthophila]